MFHSINTLFILYITAHHFPKCIRFLTVFNSQYAANGLLPYIFPLLNIFALLHVFPSILTSRHDMPHILYSEGRVLVLGVDPNDTVAQAAHGKNGTSWKRCARHSRSTPERVNDEQPILHSFPGRLILPSHLFLLLAICTVHNHMLCNSQCIHPSCYK